DRDRPAVARDRSPPPRASRARHDRALGHGACLMNLLFKLWSLYLRSPGMRAVVPFIPVVALWAIVAEMRVFPRAFLPGPLEVLHSFGSLMYKGILPEYL